MEEMYVIWKIIFLANEEIEKAFLSLLTNKNKVFDEKWSIFKWLYSERVIVSKINQLFVFYILFMLSAEKEFLKTRFLVKK